jgi:phage shock protein A
MQARSGALDELMASGALDDASMSSDRLQAELDRGFAEPAVEAELARLKGELPGGSTTAKQLDAPDEDTTAAPAAPVPAEAPVEEERR